MGRTLEQSATGAVTPAAAPARRAVIAVPHIHSAGADHVHLTDMTSLAGPAGAVA